MYNGADAFKASALTVGFFWGFLAGSRGRKRLFSSNSNRAETPWELAHRLALCVRRPLDPR